jgi:hypothetical protein
MLKPYLVVSDATKVVDVKEMPSVEEAEKALAPYLADPSKGSATIAYGRSVEDLGLNIGDSRADDLSDEMSFRGFGDDNE